MICWACDGAGHWDGKPCDDCWGSGEIEAEWPEYEGEEE